MKRTRTKLSEWHLLVQTELIKRNMSGRELATAIGYSPSYVYAVINNRHYAPKLIIAISEFLGIDSKLGLDE